jgi:hypothetical protein
MLISLIKRIDISMIVNILIEFINVGINPISENVKFKITDIANNPKRYKIRTFRFDNTVLKKTILKKANSPIKIII